MKRNSLSMTLIMLMFAVFGCISQRLEQGQIVTPTLSSLDTAMSQTPIPTVHFAVGDGGFLSDIPCGPPCFFGIEPGKTSQYDASEILAELGLIDSCPTIDHYEYAIHIGVGGWDCRRFTVSFRKSTGIVDSVQFLLDRAVTLEDVIEKYGPPDIVVLLDTGFPEYPSTQGSIYYTDLQILLPLLGEQRTFSEYTIESTTFIDGVDYLDVQSLEENLELFRDDTFPWKGYGVYP